MLGAVRQGTQGIPVIRKQRIVAIFTRQQAQQQKRLMSRQLSRARRPPLVQQGPQQQIPRRVAPQRQLRRQQQVGTGGLGEHRRGFAGHAEQLFDRGLFLVLALEDDLLCVGDDDVEARAIQRIQRCACFFEVVEAQVGG